jgi:hypothetical protein
MNGVAAGQKKIETLFYLPGNRLWIELKKDKYYVSYQGGSFYFFNLNAGTRHAITHKKSLKKFKHTSNVLHCKLNYNLLETSSFNKDQYDICLVESKLGQLPIEAYIWLMDPTLSAVPGINETILSLTPQSIKISTKSGIEVKRVLVKEQAAAIFDDDTNELWKLPLGKACTNRYCGQLI